MRQRGLAAGCSGMDRLVGGALLAALALLAAGLALPFLSVARFFIFTDRFSIIEAMGQLMAAGQWLVAAAVVLFSMLFPVAKIVLALWLWWIADLRGSLFRIVARHLDGLGKWSMLDVLVAALVIFSVKASAVADARAEPGLYLFAASVLLSMLAARRVVRRAEMIVGVAAP